MRYEKFGFLLGASLLACAAALAVSFATGSYVRFGNAQGTFTFDFKVGAAANGVATALGAIAFVAFVAALAVFRSEAGGLAGGTPADGSGSPAVPPIAHQTAAFLRQLRKSREDVWVGGVCGGLGQYTPVPSWVWRVLFLTLGICYGTGVLAYLLLWICLPEAPKADPNPPAAPPPS